ncbi:MerR family transcriptional regulator [Chengkuizengella axinellae]|uniref:MerR family transcriptional regulator n=1 Tax=Chengkuizengella axinellae TaxID=3064388 RepID=A0ABT9J4P2_9BACL|nr:MerR family transcriptional regulator [Chengkuizengella sp. 2205SS18-9]MDP5276543.1 MerR family transcriptional regulator [Chengkuizengella sp. 2205SS18-9]
MKIGQFAKQNEISIDTVRHYMDLGLIAPEKKTGQYQFDEKCNKEMKDIIYLKDLGFTLQEIKTIFQYKRLGKLSALQNNQYYKKLFEEKFNEVEQKINEYQTIRGNLQTEISKLQASESQNNKQMGIHLSVLSLLECKECHTSLNIVSGDIQHNQILDGELQCRCEEQYLIKDGILFTSDTIKQTNQLEEQTKVIDDFSYFLSDYIKETDEQFIDNVFKSIDWIHNRIDFEKLENKTLLHLGTGIGMALRQIYESVPQSCIYIAVDHDIKRHQLLKSILETYNIRKKVLFICSDFLNIPIKNNSVDYLMDTGSSEYSLCNVKFLLPQIQHYVKQDSYLIGGYLYFNNFHTNSFIEEAYRKNFQLEQIKRNIKELDYETIADTSHIQHNRYPGKYEIKLFEGEETYNYLFIGKRLG